MRQEVADAKLLVIKIGSSLLLKDGEMDSAWLESVAEDIAAAHAGGQKIIIVTSGAVALGCAALQLERGDMTLAQSQAAAAAGQIELMRGWQEALGAHGLKAAQILLTHEDTEQRRRYLNSRQTLSALLDINAIPVINENDTVATQELRFGDNDRLAARVAAMISADCLLLLSDIDGLYTANPHKTRDAAFVDIVETITPEIEAMADGTGSSHSSGGMETKLQAAHMAQMVGCHMVLASGRDPHPLKNLAQGARATLFRADANPLTARKNWIASTLHPAGKLHLDDGAARALAQGKSLLPVGVRAIDGDFDRGDCVSLVAPDGTELGRGLTAYTSATTQLMIGKDTAANTSLIQSGRAELVHRDDMVLNGVSKEPV